MRKTLLFISKIPLLGNVAIFIYRFIIIVKYQSPMIKNIFRWLFVSRETQNFTYDLTDCNKKYLASLLSNVLSRPYQEIYSYIQEVENDETLKNHIKTISIQNKKRINLNFEPKYGRRLGWYIVARAIKPKIIVETGVDKGLGSCLLTSALIKNAKGGFNGYYYGTDINPKAGLFFQNDFKRYGEILYGDSINSLIKLDKEIDLFINDSDHSAVYEEKEYEIIVNKLSQWGIVLGDNSHATEKLFEFSKKNNRQFIFFKDQPKNHWYQGAGIGISFIKK
jgi:predicted O-methyltransferase YrrM